jgi:hypothetical protein
VLLGIWGGLIPFVGPYFHYAFGGYAKWHYTNERLWLNILPAIAVVLGGLQLFSAARRPSGLLGGWLALAGGIWFVVGPVVSLLWHRAGYPIGVPAGGHVRQMFEWLGYFFGIGVLITALAAFATGRFVSRPHLVTDAALALGAAGAGPVGAEASAAGAGAGGGAGPAGAGAGADAEGAGAGAEAPRRRRGLFGRRRGLFGRRRRQPVA